MELVDEIAVIAHAIAINRRDHIACLESRLVRRRILGDARHQHASVFDTEVVGKLRRQGFDLHAKAAADAPRQEVVEVERRALETELTKPWFHLAQPGFELSQSRLEFSEARFDLAQPRFQFAHAARDVAAYAVAVDAPPERAALGYDIEGLALAAPHNAQFH